MNFAHLHLLLNHFPVIGTMIGFGLFFLSLHNRDVTARKTSLIVLVAMALISIPTFLSGVGAQLRITGHVGISDDLILRHEGSAMLAFWLMEVTGAIALVTLWQFRKGSSPAKWTTPVLIVFCLISLACMARTGNTGGDISHPELRLTTEATVSEGMAGRIFSKFEPTPSKFISAMVFNKWCTALLIDLHFVGLVLIVGTMGILDLRILGFLKQMPIAPLKKFLPWTMAGLGINVLTGMLAYTGMPDLYTYDIALWLKILALLLLGANAFLFYATDIFVQLESLKAGEDAPLLAKLLAGSSLVLWLIVIGMGRYIQILGGTIPVS